MFPARKTYRSAVAPMAAVVTAAVVTVAGVAPSAQAAEADAEDAQPVGKNVVLSKRPDGTPSVGVDSSASANGRYVAFASDADDLVAGEQGTIDHAQVYVLDRQTGTTVRVSRTAAGEPGDGDSSAPAISANGRYVAFESKAKNLVDGTDPDDAEIFRVDLSTMTTVKISHTRGGRLLRFGCSDPAISADGSMVSYTSWSRYIARQDRNRAQDVFLFHVDEDRTVLVSHSFRGGTANDASGGGSFSADGTVLAFDSGASDIEEGHSQHSDIVLFDIAAETNHVITHGDNASMSPQISADGARVAFLSWSSNFVEDVTTAALHAYVVDVDSGSIALVDRSTSGDVGDRSPDGVSISADGSLVAFSSDAHNLTAGDTNGKNDVFLRRVDSGTTTLVSASHRGGPADGPSSYPAMSSSGRYLTYSSEATNLVRGDEDGFSSVIGYRIS